MSDAPYRVVDLSRVLAGPWATQTLAEQGFDVVKVEGPDGDETRRFGPFVDGTSVYFAACNRTKRSIVLDLKRPEASPVLVALLRSADVLVENFRPGALDRLGFPAARIAAINPRLVHVAITAFGDEGAWATRAGYDLVMQAVGGLAALNADPPRKTGPSAADLYAGQVAVQAALFGLLERARTGRGRRTEVRMLDVAHHLLGYYASAALNAGAGTPPASNRHPSIAPYNLYRCADGWLAVACANEGLWRRLRDALALPDDPAWGDIRARVADVERLDATITEVLRTDSVAAWEARLAASGVPCGAVLDVAGSLAHPAARRIELDGWAFPAPPIPPVRVGPPPALGAHTREVLDEVGFSADAIDALLRGGVVATGS